MFHQPYDNQDLLIMLGELAQKHPDAHAFVFKRLGELAAEHKKNEQEMRETLGKRATMLGGSPESPRLNRETRARQQNHARRARR